MILLGGIALFVAGISLGAYRAYRVIAKERILAIAALAIFLTLAESLDAVWIIVIMAVSGIVALTAEHFRIEVNPARATN